MTKKTKPRSPRKARPARRTKDTEASDATLVRTNVFLSEEQRTYLAHVGAKISRRAGRRVTAAAVQRAIIDSVRLSKIHLENCKSAEHVQAALGIFLALGVAKRREELTSSKRTRS